MIYADRDLYTVLEESARAVNRIIPDLAESSLPERDYFYRTRILTLRSIDRFSYLSPAQYVFYGPGISERIIIIYYYYHHHE